MKNLICSIMGHKLDGTFSITYKDTPPKDILIICSRCLIQVDLSKYYDFSCLTKKELGPGDES